MAKILIVEDNNDFRDVVENLLKEKFTDLEIFQALTAEDGFGLAVHEKPDVILMDIHLPNMNGMDAAKLIKEKVAGCKIILADDHEILRTGLRKLIDNEGTMQVAAEASDGEELLEKLEKTRCDMVILDLSMPNMDGISALKEIRKKFPKVKIIVLTMQKNHEQFKLV